MLIEAPLGNILAEPTSEPIDWLDLTWSECHQRALRKQTRGGQDVRLLLRLGMTLKHGDLLHRGQSTIAVNVLLSSVLVARPLDLALFGAACYELGSLHVPVQLDAGRIITIVDGPVEAVLDRLGVPYEVHKRRFEPAPVPAGQVIISDRFVVNRRPASGLPIAEIAPMPPT